MGDPDVSALVRRLRRKAGLSQEELAHRSGLGLRTISYLESGRTRQPRGASLRLLADALGVAPADLTAAGGGPMAIGCQLPADDPHFAGRSAEKARLADLLAPTGGTPLGVAVTVVHGQPGVGKTALGIHVAHALRDRFPDGQLYAGLGGGTSPTGPAEVLGRFLRALGSELTPGSLTLDEQAAEFRAKLTDRRVLVVLDDAATEAQVRPLLPGTPGCAVLVTSRAPLAGLLGAGSVALEVLEFEDAVALLGRVLGADRVAAEVGAARRIAGACAGLPLALRIAAARSAAPGMSMAELADVLDDEGSRLDGLTVGDVAVQASFAVGYRSLDPLARRTYRLLGLLRAVDIPTWAVSALLDADRPSTDTALAALVAARLLDRHGAGAWTHYRMHDLVKLDARARAGAEDPAPDRRAAVRRALSGWLYLAAEADRRLPSDTMPLPEPPPAGWQVDPDTASVLLAEPLEWFEVERSALVEAVRQAVVEAPDLAVGLVDGLVDFCATRDYPDDWEAAAGLLVGWAEESGDLRLSGHGRRRLAEAQVYRRGDAAAVDRLARQAIAACTAAGDPAGAGAARLQLAMILRVTGRPADALQELAQARIELATGWPSGAAHADHELAMAWLALGDRGTAEHHFTAASDVLLRTGDLRGGANALSGRALNQLRDGRPEAALASAVEAVEIIQRIGDRRMLPAVKVMVGAAQVETGDLDAGVETLRSVIEASQDLNVLDVEGVSWCYLGEAHLRQGDLPAASAALARSGDLLSRTELLSWQARVQYGMGRVAIAEGDQDRARRTWTKAAELYAGTEPQRAEEIRGEIGGLLTS